MNVGCLAGNRLELARGIERRFVRAQVLLGLEHAVQHLGRGELLKVRQRRTWGMNHCLLGWAPNSELSTGLRMWPIRSVLKAVASSA
eukprot:6299142-Pyramimonas_sp.AAC.1